MGTYDTEVHQVVVVGLPPADHSTVHQRWAHQRWVLFRCEGMFEIIGLEQGQKQGWGKNFLSPGLRISSRCSASSRSQPKCVSEAVARSNGEKCKWRKYPQIHPSFFLELQIFLISHNDESTLHWPNVTFVMELDPYLTCTTLPLMCVCILICIRKSSSETMRYVRKIYKIHLNVCQS